MHTPTHTLLLLVHPLTLSLTSCHLLVFLSRCTNSGSLLFVCRSLFMSSVSILLLVCTAVYPSVLSILSHVSFVLLHERDHALYKPQAYYIIIGVIALGLPAWGELTLHDNLWWVPCPWHSSLHRCVELSMDEDTRTLVSCRGIGSHSLSCGLSSQDGFSKRHSTN